MGKKNKDIAIELGYDRGWISEVIGGTKKTMDYKVAKELSIKTGKSMREFISPKILKFLDDSKEELEKLWREGKNGK